MSDELLTPEQQRQLARDLAATRQERDEANERAKDADADWHACMDFLAASQAELERLREAIEWACGEGGSDFYSEAERKERGLPIYWWRERLRAALSPSTPEEN